MKIGDFASWIAIAGALIGVGVTWGTMTSQIANLAEQVRQIEDRAADQICLSIVSRQVAAIEKSAKSDVTSRLDQLAEKSGCNKQYGSDIVMTSTVAIKEQELQALAVKNARLHQEIQRELGAIDGELACAGNGPFLRGSAGYDATLDKDGDGVACE